MSAAEKFLKEFPLSRVVRLVAQYLNNSNSLKVLAEAYKNEHNQIDDTMLLAKAYEIRIEVEERLKRRRGNGDHIEDIGPYCNTIIRNILVDEREKLLRYKRRHLSLETSNFKNADKQVLIRKENPVESYQKEMDIVKILTNLYNNKWSEEEQCVFRHFVAKKYSRYETADACAINYKKVCRLVRRIQNDFSEMYNE